MTPLELLEIADPGLLATVQDLGRPGAAGLGASTGGAADPVALRVANELLGNDPGAAAIEVTGGPLHLIVLHSCTIAVARGEASCDGGRAGPASTMTVAAGSELTVVPGPGLRAVFAIPGGIDVPVVLGSRSTDLRAGFGGFDGRALVPGDRLVPLAAPGALVRREARWPTALPDTRSAFRVVAGPHATHLGEAARDALAQRRWVVGAASDRMGLRLDGEPVTRSATGELASLPVAPGAIQVPPDGRPIVLLADAQPTGGYPVIAVVAAADRARLGQLRPGDTVAFTWIDTAGATRLRAQAETAFHDARAHLQEAALWDELWRGAGG